MDKTITAGMLRQVVESLGYHRDSVRGRRAVYRNPDRSLFLLLPEASPQDVVSPIDLLSVQKTLANDGVVEEGEFPSLFRIRKGDRLIWKEPSTGKETHVTAAAGESDGMVIIKQKGNFSVCPIDQLRKETFAQNGVGTE